MFSTKKEVDRHVKTSISRLPEHERNLRGLVIARQYFKLGEYSSAENWLSLYLNEREDCPQGHKLLGQCYEKLKKIDKAVTEYQRSLQLDSKQTGLITEICKLILSDETLSRNLSKAKHWCDLAESQRINSDAVLKLKLKVANKDTTDTRLVKDIIMKEILARPTDPSPRITLVKHFLEENKIDEAFNYCYEVEMKFPESFQQSIEWCNTVSSMLSEANAANYQQTWNYWLLSVMILERQISLNLAVESTMIEAKANNLKEISNQLWEFDQLLRKFMEKGKNSAAQKQLADEFLKHYRGQLLLYQSSLMFKKGKGRESLRKSLPMLLLAFQCGVPDTQDLFLKHANEVTRNLMAYWQKQAAFRCFQAGTTILSCIDDSLDASIIAEIHSVTDNKIHNTAEDILSQIRQFCADTEWRKNIFKSLYTNSDKGSYFLQHVNLNEADIEMPKVADVERYQEIAQYLYPLSLVHLVYLGLGMKRLSDFHCKMFNGWNFSTNNLENTSPDTLNQLDMDSFVYCSVLVAKSRLEADRKYMDKAKERPLILPAPNMNSILCDDQKIEWWTAAYQNYKNVTVHENRARNKQLLQHGLQAVRGADTPLADPIIMLKVAEIFTKRAEHTLIPDEKRFIELRAETLYKMGILAWKVRQEGSFGASTIFFKYAIDTVDCNPECVKLSEDGIKYLAGRYFKTGRYEEFTQDFAGVPLPFAAYFRSEAYKKMCESNKTPLKNKKFYTDKARDSMRLTLRYLDLPYIEKAHPLHCVVQTEVKRSALNESSDSHLNSSFNGLGAGDDSDHFQSFTSSINTAGALNRSERDSVAANSDTINEIEVMLRKMMETLNLVKDDVLSIRNDVGDMQDRLGKIEDHIQKKPIDEEQVLNDLYILDELQNQPFNPYNPQIPPVVPQLTPRITPQAQAQQAAAVAAAAQFQQMYNTTYPMYMQYPPQQAGRSPLPQYGDNNLLVTASGAYYTPPTAPAAPQIRSTSLIEQALQNPSLLNTWTNTYGAPVVSSMSISAPAVHHPTSSIMDKSPPVNVVITNSDPLPTNISIVTTQPTYSVTIPPQHIKHSVVVAPPVIENISPVVQQAPQPPVVQPFISFGFKPPTKPIVSEVLEDEDDDKLNESAEYDPRPDFQPIIPLPDEVEVKTGEENEDVLFSGRSRLHRFINGEWKEKGVGDLKILRTKIDPSKIRIVMRRDQVHKICANHFITTETTVKPMKNNDKCYIWGALDYSDEEPKKESFCARFKTAELAKQFFDKFNEIVEELGKLEKKEEIVVEPVKPVVQELPKATTLPIFGGFSFSTPKPEPLLPQPAAATTTATLSTTFGGMPIPVFSLTATTSATTTVIASPFKSSFSFGGNVVPQVTPVEPEKPKESSEPAKPSPFASFTFGTPKSANTDSSAGNKSLSDIFGSLNKTSTPTSAVQPLEEAAMNKSAEDVVEEYEPSVDFKPVIPLPDLVEVKTGEENFETVYEHRAKMLRFDKETKEWKDRGIGNIKISVKKDDPNTVRLLMRREQVLKLCCNQLLTKDLKFKKLAINGTALSWIAHDYSENEMIIETFAIRFKTAEICDDFYAQILKAQANMSDVKPVAPFEKQVEEKEDAKGFGDKFKPKAGSWTCDGCYLTNTGLYCTACESPKDSSVPKKEASKGVDLTSSSGTKFNFGMPAPAPMVPQQSSEAKKDEPKGFGDKFKLKAGSWNCEGCYLTNTGDALYCTACEAPKDSSVPKKEASKGVSLTSSSGTKFNFGMPAPVAMVPQQTSEAKKDESKGFGDKFKPKAGSWNCESCYLTNTGDALYCTACEAPKDSTVPKKEPTNVLATSTTTKFSFGMPAASGFSFGSPATPAKTEVATVTAPVVSGFSFGMPTSGTTPAKTDEAATVKPTVASGFSFGMPVSSTVTATVTSTSTISTSTSFSFNKPAPPEATETDTKTSFAFNKPPPAASGFSFGLNANTPLTFGVPPSTNTVTTVAAPATPKKDTFSFVFKPKSPKSPKNSICENGDVPEHDENDESYTEEENNTYFTPVIVLPDKVEVKTGEEEEEVFYSHRAKLFRFMDSEWKERGIGDVKILKHKETEKLRVVMRRDQVLKICLNHALNEDMSYTRKDTKSWQFVANDFSEGELDLMTFSLRFKTPEIADDFKNAIDASLKGEVYVALNDSTLSKDNTIVSPVNASGINFSGLSDISLSERELAMKYKLPIDFYDQTTDCPGCPGCEPDDFVFPIYENPNNDLADDKPLPLKAEYVKPIVNKLSKSPKRVSFSVEDKPEEVKENKSFFSITNFEKPAPGASIFGGKVESPFKGFANLTPATTPPTGSIFSPSMNTTPTSVEQSPSNTEKTPSKSPIQPGNLFSGSKTPESSEEKKPDENKVDEKKPEGGHLFGGSSFLFGQSKPAFGSNTTPSFGSGGSIFGGSTISNTSDTKSSIPVLTNGGNSTTPVFGSSSTTFGSFSFTAAAKELEKENEDKENSNKTFGKGSDSPSSFADLAVNKTEPDLLKKADSGASFASLATIVGSSDSFLKKNDSASSGFVGLTIKEDIFSKFAKGKNDTNEEGQEESVTDENYDPHYDPIIKLPDEIIVRTGEEDEEKIYGERAKLFRWVDETKEWKERGIGELKILHHPARNSYRFLLRREQIFKCVLNHAITANFSMSPMNNSDRSYVWAAMNHAEEEPQVEKLALRFKNEDLGREFKRNVDACLDKLRSKTDLEPEQD